MESIELRLQRKSRKFKVQNPQETNAQNGAPEGVFSGLTRGHPPVTLFPPGSRFTRYERKNGFFPLAGPGNYPVYPVKDDEASFMAP